MTRGDRILIALVACIALVSVPLVSLASSGTATQAVVEAPQGRTTIDLSKDASYEIGGRTGVVHLQVQAGEVRVTEASCPDKVCVQTGVAGPGRPIVCAPNGVIVSVAGQQKDGLDAVNR